MASQASLSDVNPLESEVPTAEPSALQLENAELRQRLVTLEQGYKNLEAITSNVLKTAEDWKAFATKLVNKGKDMKKELKKTNLARTPGLPCASQTEERNAYKAMTKEGGHKEKLLEEQITKLLAKQAVWEHKFKAANDRWNESIDRESELQDELAAARKEIEMLKKQANESPIREK